MEHKFKIVVFFGQMGDSMMIPHSDTCNSILDICMFGVYGKMMVVVATRAQTTAKVELPSMDESKDI